MALGGKGVSSSAGDGLVGCDTGLSSGFASLQLVDLFDGINVNTAKAVNYTKVPGSAAVFSPLTTMFTFTGGNQSLYRGPSGLLIQSVTNQPRLEYGAYGESLGLLMEASRTNLCLQSQDLSTTWINERSSESVNSTVAPDGTTTADKIVEDSTASNTHAMFQNIVFANATPYTFSVFIKPAERTWIGLQLPSTAFTSATFAYFNFSGAGSVGTTGGSPTATSITAYANGWYRCSITKTSTAAVGGDCYIYMASGDSGAAYSGDGTSGLYAWGSQVEAGAFPSSYIPTTTVSVARTADSCIRTLSTEFSATAGTVVVAGRASGGQDAATTQLVWSLDDGTANNRVFLLRPTASDAASFRNVSGAVLDVALDGTFTNLTTFKSAAAFAVNDYATSFNGAAVLTDTVAALPIGVTKLGFGNLAGTGQMNGHIRIFDYYPTRKPNTYLVDQSA